MKKVTHGRIRGTYALPKRLIEFIETSNVPGWCLITAALDSFIPLPGPERDEKIMTVLRNDSQEDE